MIQGVLGLALAWILGSVVKRVILGLGVSVLVYTGVSALIDQVNNYISTYLAAVPASLVQLVSVLNVGTAINMLLAAITFHYTFMLTGKKIVFAPPT